MATIDEVIGANLIKIRRLRAVSQMELGERIGVSFQQIQKYEKGTTRISVLRLQQLAKALDVPITALLQEELPARVSGPAVQYGQGREAGDRGDLLNKEEALLLKLFRMVENKKIREGIIKQMRGIVELELHWKNRKK